MTVEEKFKRAKAERAVRQARLTGLERELGLSNLPLGERMKRASQMMTQDFKDILGEIAEKRKHDRF